MKKWVKGGLIAVGVLIVLYILGTISLFNIGKSTGNIFLSVAGALGWPILFIFRNNLPIGFLLLIPYYFLIGALIGWLLSRKKRRK